MSEREEITALYDKFQQDGYAILRNSLRDEQVEKLITTIDEIFEKNKLPHSTNRWNDYVMLRCFELDKVFIELITLQPVLNLIEMIISPNCHVIADCAFRQQSGQSISDWHVDDDLLIPLPHHITADATIPLPVLQINVMFPLTPLLDIADGPTQIVPGSHLSGQLPDCDSLTFRGKEVESLFCHPGDIYLFNGQCWHRGAPICHDTQRYMYSLTFSPRWVSQRFYPYVDYQLPEHIKKSNDQRLLRLMGRHERGDYG